tara:strand:+ start:101 stop:538 length:438 start_codon:yes stop_codon:yes gene_type:complete
MLRINQKIKNNYHYLLNILVILVLILINLFIRTNLAYGSNISWIEISKTPAGIQYLDKDSLDIKPEGIIELKTKYLKTDTKNSKKKEVNIYIMQINCLTAEFKDISVNGKKNLTTKWEDPNGDKLLDDLISNSCKNVKTTNYLKE